MKAVPTIRKFMTVVPQSIDSETTIAQVKEEMRSQGFRHFPVDLGQGRFGLISEKDVLNILSFAGVDPETLRVGEICQDEVYQTTPESPITEVSETMAEKKLGSALVLDNGKLVGIFTVTDALRALAEIAKMRFHS